jgi:hypothetical protein
VVLHLVPPLVVVIAAEAVADLQHALTQSGTRLTTVHRAQQSTRPEPVTRAAVNGEARDCAVHCNYPRRTEPRGTVP